MESANGHAADVEAAAGAGAAAVGGLDVDGVPPPPGVAAAVPAGGASSASLKPSVSASSLVVEATYRDIAREFAVLGWTAFGGPAAHIAMFQKTFVDRLRWLTYPVFAELLMLGQCIPGPTSTQMGFSIGVLKKGLRGGALSGVLFQGPGLLILSVLGWAAAEVLDDAPAWLDGVVAGLAAAGVALVAAAAQGLLANICKGRQLQVIAAAAAVVAYYYPKPWTFPALIVAGGLATLVLRWRDPDAPAAGGSEATAAEVTRLGFGRAGGALLIAAWAAVLVGVVVGARATEYDSAKELHWFAAFYRTGSVIFGGGQVVLPMLYNDVVDCAANGTDSATGACVETSSSWVTEEQFLAGLAISQALPGPLFNFAAYLGAAIAQTAGVSPIVGIAVCWVGLFAPGIMLIFGVLPYWGAFRRWKVYRRALPGLNAAAVGLIVAAVFQLGLKAYESSPFPNASISIGIVAFSAAEVLGVFAPLVVAGGGLLGLLAWGVDMN